jgi:hypothetical protein
MRSYHKGRTMGCPGYQMTIATIIMAQAIPSGGFLSCRNISTGDRAVQRLGAIKESGSNQKT